MSILNSNNNRDTREKDIHRYSFSRFKTFHTCPRKHQYQYLEQIETEESATTIPGKLFHKCVEQTLKGEDIAPTLKEFRDLCMSGKLDLEPDLLEYIVSKYFQYYSKDYQKEHILMVEQEFNDPLEGEDYLTLIVDQVVEKDGLVTVRDIKTTQNNLKYTYDDVVHNQQLLMYVPYVEQQTSCKVDLIEIDEVRLAKLEQVPINNNGKPTADRRRLALVSYEDYFDVLSSMGLETEKEYQPTLEYLKQRGHPLFNRITAQVLDPNMVDTNAQDMINTYKTIKEQSEKTKQYASGNAYRVRGPLCKYCAYQDLCEYDMHAMTEAERRIYIEKIQEKI